MKLMVLFSCEIEETHRCSYDATKQAFISG